MTTDEYLDEVDDQLTKLIEGMRETPAEAMLSYCDEKDVLEAARLVERGRLKLAAISALRRSKR